MKTKAFWESTFFKWSLSPSVKYDLQSLSPFQMSPEVKETQYVSQTGGLIFSQVIPYINVVMQTVIKLSNPANAHSSGDRSLFLL